MLDAFRTLAVRKPKQVANTAPIAVVPATRSSSSSSSSKRGGSDGKSDGAGLKINTALRGLGPAAYLSFPSPDIRASAAQRLVENPSDAKWFKSIDITTAPIKSVAKRHWRASNACP